MLAQSTFSALKQLQQTDQHICYQLGGIQRVIQNIPYQKIHNYLQFKHAAGLPLFFGQAIPMFACLHMCWQTHGHMCVSRSDNISSGITTEMQMVNNIGGGVSYDGCFCATQARIRISEKYTSGIFLLFFCRKSILLVQPYSVRFITLHNSCLFFEGGHFHGARSTYLKWQDEAPAPTGTAIISKAEVSSPHHPLQRRI